MIQTIESVVCRSLNVSCEAIHSKRQQRCLVFPRQAIMYYARLLTKMSWSEIACYFGKDHATAIHAYKAIHNIIETDKNLRLKFLEIDKELGLGNVINERILAMSFCEGLESEIKKFEKKVDELRGMLKDIKNELKNLK